MGRGPGKGHFAVVQVWRQIGHNTIDPLAARILLLQTPPSSWHAAGARQVGEVNSVTAALSPPHLTRNPQALVLQPFMTACTH